MEIQPLNTKNTKTANKKKGIKGMAGLATKLTQIKIGFLLYLSVSIERIGLQLLEAAEPGLPQPSKTCQARDLRYKRVALRWVPR